MLALAEDEELVYGKITKAVGNDITVTVLDVKADGAPQGMNGQGGAAPDAEGQGNAPGGDFGNDGSQRSDAQGTESQGAGPQSPEASDSQMQSTAPQQNTLQYMETSQTKEYEVPVGTEVTTRLGATTSFSRLSTGNIVGIVVQKGTDNILRIKIVE